MKRLLLALLLLLAVPVLARAQARTMTSRDSAGCAAASCAAVGSPRYCVQTTTLFICDPVTHLYVAVASGGSGSPGGSNTQVQINSGGVFAGDSGLTFNTATDALTIGGALTVGGNSTINGTLTGLTGLTVASGTVTLPAGQIDASEAVASFVQDNEASTFSQLQTFNGRILVSGTGTDLTIATGSVPTAAQGLTTGGFCSSANSYRFYIAWVGATGISNLTGASTPDLTPSSTTSQVSVTRPSVPTNATGWLAYWSSSADAHATINSCGTLGFAPQALHGTGGLSAFPCYCVTSPDFTPSSNATHAVVPLSMSGDGLSLPEWRTVTVSPAGTAQFTTINAAVASITDASWLRRYVVHIYPGEYKENVTMKNFVFLQGENRDAVRILGNGSNGGLDIGNTIYYSGIANLTVGGQKPLESTGSPAASQQQFFVTNCNIGINDNSVNFPSNDVSELSIDGVLDQMGNRDWYVTGSLYRNKFDSVVVTTGSHYYGTGNTFYITDKYSPAAASMRLWRNNGFGTIDEEDFSAFMEGSTTALGATGVDMNAGGTDGGKYRIGPGTIQIVLNDAGSQAEACVSAISNSTFTNPTLIEMLLVNCIVDGKASGHTPTGVLVGLDSDHSNFTINWKGGSISTVGGVGQIDVNNAETTVGFSLNFYGTVMAGTHSGAGTEKYVSVPLTTGVTRNSGLGSAPPTCNIGEDYAGSDGSLWHCVAANTWNQVLAPPANTFTLPGATSLPGTCTANRSIFVDTDATPAGQQVYLCNATGNGWNIIGDGGSGSAAWSALTSGTSTAAFLMGSGGSIGVTGTGTIAATDLNCTACVSASELGSAFVDAASDFSSGFGSDGQILKKVSGTWQLAADATGGSPSFDTITSNTNTTAAMVVGTGATLTASGSGSIVATTGDSATAFFPSGTLEDARLSANVPLLNIANVFASIGTQQFQDPVSILPDATNGVTINSSGLLAKTGTGSVQADDVNCSGCVDLSSEVTGTLPAASISGTLTDAQVSDTLTCSAVTQGAAPSLTSAGQVGVDTTADQWLWYSGAGVQVESATKEVCAIIPNLSVNDDNFEFWTPPYPVHATAGGCYCRGTCAAALPSFQFTNRAGTAMTGTPTCATGTSATTFTNLTGSTALVAGDGLRFNVTNSPLGSEGVDTYTICVKYTIDRQ